MQELLFLHSARRLMMVDICMKFHDASLYGLKVISGHDGDKTLLGTKFKGK